MINLKFLNQAVDLTDGNEFRVLYVIANTISLKKEGRTKIYREMLADRLNLSTKQISRITDKLVEKGLLRKDLISNGDKSVCFYALNLDKNVHQSTSKLDTDVPLNKRNNIEIKENNNEKKEKEKKSFDVNCELSKEEIEEFCTEELEDEIIPDEETIGQYQERMRRKCAFSTK